MWRARTIRIGAAIVFFATLLYLTVGPLSTQLEAAGIWLAEHVGLPGVFVYVYVVDTFIVPAAVDLLFPFLGSWSFVPVVAVMSAASIAGGVSGFLIGRNLNRVPAVNRITTRYLAEHGDLFVKYGRRTVILAALLPIPFSTISWIAGSFDMPLKEYVPGALFRIPRMAITLWMFQSGVSLFG
ncbi:MAG: VTT domain-containing protein [Spirochaetaceae bacterium]